ncbi:NnrS family protein [Bradyrhizobium sp.]|uniref:NnrS family protein n=1 Tax=Bradyrhizobium sp. TaxID=376 RepID=UPI0025BCEFCB|nr:NnrS family protein [Bradyrhizobium sp.]
MTAASRPRAHQGWPLLAAGFRPFFLLGSIYAGLAILVWLPVFHGEITLVSAFAPRDWHVHEMLYGYLPAVITGFLFTAIPNWTGRLPIQGSPLLALVLVWIAGRLVVTLSAETGWLTAMLVDASFLALVAAAAAREILAGRNWKNLNVVILVLLLLAGNVAFHLEAHFHGVAATGIRIGIAVVVLLISLIGGRIIPSFTRNWLVRENPGRLPAPFGRFDMIVVAITALTLLSWVVSPESRLTGAALAFTGLLHLARLARWAGDRTVRERLLLILHVGYAFVPFGFMLNAASAFDLVPPGAGVHAWMAGAAGTMTLAVMSRATLGHTGQPLTASLATQAIYLAIIVAALARVCAVVEPAYGEPLLHVAAFAWAAAFLGFAITFGPLLAGADRRRKVVT